jgi:Methyltransferase domain/C-methyltransferase C-terminal domain
MIKCPLTGSENTQIIYQQQAVPLIQNKVYPTKAAAEKTACIDVTLAQSLDNGFVFSANFDDSIISYDENYQNEQSNSSYFQKHLDNVIEIMQENKTLDGKVVEIGCGKAYFMDMLLAKGYDVTGFDPTYEGDSPKVVKDFFSDKYAGIGASFIILRHTLEHIANPLEFINTVAAANNYKGKIYIEVPTFEWIMKHNAIEDIFYEHCNYFTLDTLQMLFTKSVGGHIFNGQYIYVIAELADVKKELEKREVTPYVAKFKERLAEYDALLKHKGATAIWGVGAKGSTFLNLLDKKAEKVTCVVDINPKKQHQYVGGTGHYIIKPEELQEYKIENIIVMNINYIDEIKAVTEPLNINLITL